MTIRRTALAAVLVSLLAGCSSGAPGFGPDAGFDHDLDPKAAAANEAPRVPPAYAASAVRTKALAVRRTRMDAGDPLVQNYEVSIGVARADPTNANGDVVFATWMTGREASDNRTTTGLRAVRTVDGGATFQPLALQIPEPAAPIPADPAVVADRASGRTYIGSMGQVGAASSGRRLWVARATAADAAAFAPGALIPQPASADHDKIWLAAGRTPGNAAQSVLYAVDRTGAIASLDEGATWNAPVRMPNFSNLPQPLVLNDGALGVSYYGTGNQALYARSTDFARTFSPSRVIHSYVGTFSEIVGAAVPGGFRLPPTTVFAQSPVDGTLYAVLHDVTRRAGSEVDLDVLLFSSADGTTWSPARNVTSTTSGGDQFLPWVAVDAAGRVHVAWYDTQRTPVPDAASETDVDVWYGVSSDRGATFETVRLTDAPIPSGRTRWSPLISSTTPASQFLGDYFSMAVSTRAAYVAHPLFENDTLGMALSRIDIGPAGATTIRDLRGLTGAWFDPATSGQGVELQWLQGEKLLVIWYGHHDNGENFFLVGTRDGRFGYGETIEVPVVATTGGRYDGLDPNAIRRTPWGTVRLTFASCARATARVDGVDGVQIMNIERLALAPDLPCD